MPNVPPREVFIKKIKMTYRGGDYYYFSSLPDTKNLKLDKKEGNVMVEVHGFYQFITLPSGVE